MTEAQPPEPVQGHREFIAEKHDLMRAFQSAREKSASRPLPGVEPGDVAEGVFRSWLERFLPMRYGVTSGYIISSGLPASTPMKHFDVIIYDKLEAPVLWRDNNPDRSNQGLHRPIPVEHVLAVLEVKSTLSRTAIRSALEKLHELDPLLAKSDTDDEFYPRYLSNKFICGVVFFRVPSAEPISLLNPLVLTSLRGWMGGVILSRAEHELGDNAGWIFGIGPGDEPIAEHGNFGLDSSTTASQQRGEKHYSAGVLFSSSSFAIFAFSLLSLLSGRSRPGYLPSLHGLGFTMNPLTGVPREGGP